jgi:hypothetical protein
MRRSVNSGCVDMAGRSKIRRMVKRALKGVLIGLLPVAALWVFVLWQRSKDPLGYGMAILPLILLSVILFAIVFSFFFLTTARKN